jgi:hypothetical protein
MEKRTASSAVLVVVQQDFGYEAKLPNTDMLHETCKDREDETKLCSFV